MKCLLPYKFSLAQLHGTLVAVKQVRISAADGVDMSEVKALRLLVINSLPMQIDRLRWFGSYR